MTPTIGSLCSGYGGLDAAVETVFGARTVWHCQYEPPAKGKKPKPLAEQAPSKILAAHWDVPNHGDLTTVDWTTVEPVDIIAAGYPCQPDSMAGKGLSQDDDRWIWPDIARAVGVLRPRLVVLENVQGHFVRGFRTVLGSLTGLGYDVRWTLVRAADVGAPHRRERMFVIASDASDERHERGRVARGWRAGSANGGIPTADADRSGSQGREPAAGRHMPDRGAAPDTSRNGRHEGWTESAGIVGGSHAAQRSAVAADADRSGSQGREPAAGRHMPDRGAAANTDRDTLREQPVTESGRSGEAVAGLARADTAADADRDGLQGVGRLEPVRCDADGRGGADVAWGAYEPAIRRWERVLGRVAPAPTERGPKGGQRLSPRFVEWMMGLPAGWVTDVPISRNEQLKALGNGVVPQQAEAALRALLSVDAGEVAA